VPRVTSVLDTRGVAGRSSIVRICCFMMPGGCVGAPEEFCKKNSFPEARMIFYSCPLFQKLTAGQEAGFPVDMGPDAA